MAGPKKPPGSARLIDAQNEGFYGSAIFLMRVTVPTPTGAIYHNDSEFGVFFHSPRFRYSAMPRAELIVASVIALPLELAGDKIGEAD